MSGIDSYANLKLAIYKWLIRDTSDLVVTDQQVTNYIQLCESEMNRRLKNTRFMYNTSVLTMIAGQNFLPLPAGFRKVLSMNYQSQPPQIDYVPPDIFADKFSYAGIGRPEVYTITDTTFLFGATPDAAYMLDLFIRKIITPLDNTNTVNSILTNYPDAYLYGALKHANLNIKNQTEIQNVAAIFEAAMNDILDEGVSSSLPVGARMRAKPIGGNANG